MINIPGVNSAVPHYSGGALAKPHDGTDQFFDVLGMGDSPLFGRPRLTAGNIQGILVENAFIVVKPAKPPCGRRGIS